MIDSAVVPPAASRGLRILALGLFALFLAVSLPLAALRAGKRILQAVGVAGEGTAAARRRVLGERWVEAVEALRRTVPADGSFFLVDASEESEGGAYWVRFELAPRRPLYLGNLTELPPPERLAPVLAAGPAIVIVALRDREPPLLYDRGSFLKALASLPRPSASEPAGPAASTPAAGAAALGARSAPPSELRDAPP